MLRHLRMAPATKEVPRSEGRLLGMIHEWCRPLYRYRIPHTPTPRDRVCTCAYPLYTLRSSRRSPYDEPTPHAVGLETIYVTSTCPTPSPCAAASSSPSPSSDGQGSAQAPSSTEASGASTSTTTASFLSSFGGLPSLRARWAVRRRTSRQSASDATTPAAPPPSPKPAETCYRCDICDGLQPPCTSSEEGTGAATPCSHGRPLGGGAACSGGAAGSTAGGPVAEKTGTPGNAAHPTGSSTMSSAEWNEEEENEAGGSGGSSAAASSPSLDERFGHAISTDIANTAMEDADVAELRHLDPFHVEVFGRPSWSALTKRIAREVQAQMTRCGLRKRDVSHYASQATQNSDVGRQTYRMWVRQESRRIRERQMQLSNAAATGTTAATAADGAPSQLTLAPAEQAIIKGKLDTLVTASYLGRYAIAAYGLPFELNYFSSLQELAKLMAEPHRRYVCANSEEQLESMRRMLQGEEPDALLECVAGRYSLRVGQSCWAVFLDHAASRVVLTFRGSMTPADIVVDVTEGYANVVLEHTTAAEADDSAAGTPHRLCTAIPLGFYESVVEAGAQLLPVLRAVHAQYASYQLCITGHSLGGIQASLFHLLYCGPWRATLHSSTSLMRRTKPLACAPAAPLSPPSTMTDAPPSKPAVGQRVTAESVAATPAATAPRVPFTRTVTYTFGAAPVVERRVVPLLNAWLQQEEQRTGSRLVAFSNGMDLISRLQVRALQDACVQQYARPSPDTMIDSAEAAAAESTVDVADVVAVSDKSVPVLAIPGSLYNMTAGTRRRHLLAVPVTATGVRDQVVLTPEATVHHFPSLYLRSLNELLRRYEAKWQAICDTAAASRTCSGAESAPAAPKAESNKVA